LRKIYTVVRDKSNTGKTWFYLYRHILILLPAIIYVMISSNFYSSYQTTFNNFYIEIDTQLGLWYKYDTRQQNDRTKALLTVSNSIFYNIISTIYKINWNR